MQSVRRHHSLAFRNASTAIMRLWPDATRMESTYNAILTAKFRRSLGKVDRKRLARWMEKTLLESKVYFSLGREVSLNLDVEAQDAKAMAYARIPVRLLTDIRKLPKSSRLPALADLLDQYGKSGNGCNHNPSGFSRDGLMSPYDVDNKRDPVTGSGRRPQIVYEVIDRFIQAIINPSRYKDLFFKRVKYYVAKHDANYRQIRSEGRESMLAVMKVLLLAWQPRTMRCGHYQKDGSFTGISIAQLASWAGLSESRIKTGLRLLREQGMLYRGKQKKEKREDGSFAGKPVVRVMKKAFLFFLGLEPRMLDERVDPSLRKAEAKDAALKEQALQGQRVEVDTKYQQLKSSDDVMASLANVF